MFTRLVPAFLALFFFVPVAFAADGVVVGLKSKNFCALNSLLVEGESNLGKPSFVCQYEVGGAQEKADLCGASLFFSAQIIGEDPTSQPEVVLYELPPSRSTETFTYGQMNVLEYKPYHQGFETRLQIDSDKRKLSNVWAKFTQLDDGTTSIELTYDEATEPFFAGTFEETAVALDAQ